MQLSALVNCNFFLWTAQVARLCSFIQKWAPPKLTISGVFKLKSQLVMNARHIRSFRKGFAGLLSFWRGWTWTVNVRLINLTLWWWIIALLKYLLVLCTAVNFTKITFSCFLREAVWMCITHVCYIWETLGTNNNNHNNNHTPTNHTTVEP